MSNIDVDSINDLAQHIRQVNGNNDMGATKLSESILEWQAARAQTVQGGGVPEIVATFECESNGVTGSTTAPIRRIELHDDGTIEVILDYWSTSPYSGEQCGEWVRCDERQTDAINHALDVLSKHGDAFTSIGAMLVLEEMLEPQPPKAKETSHDNH